MNQPPGVFNVAVEAVIIKDGKILITQRSFDREHEPGQWEILTGRVNQNESLEEAIVRETKEEVDLEIVVLQPFSTFHFYRGAQKVEHQGISFLCNYKAGEVKLEETEQISFKWATPTEALKLITNPNIQDSIRKAKEILNLKD